VRHNTIVTLAAVLLLPAGTFADGYRMKDGRYASGPVTVLPLTAEQALTARTARVVVLNADQKQLLQREAQVAPTVLHIHSLAVAGKDCTCGQYNYAIWFRPDRIEVPHGPLISDEEAARAVEDEEAPFEQITP